jgi:hypothetical protein
MDDIKTISASGVTVLLSFVAGMGGGAITSKTTQELTIKAGATSVDRAVYATAQLSKTVRPMTAVKRWAVVDGVQTLSWWCDADAGSVPCPAATATELDKVSAEGVSATLTPTQVGEEARYTISVQPGVAPERPEIDAEQAALVGLKRGKVEAAAEAIEP